jgi:hypothetical protein
LQDVAYADVQVSVADSPASIMIDDALIDTVGWGAGAEPPPHADSRSNAASIGDREINRMTSQIYFFYRMSSIAQGTCGDSQTSRLSPPARRAYYLMRWINATHIAKFTADRRGARVTGTRSWFDRRRNERFELEIDHRS